MPFLLAFIFFVIALIAYGALGRHEEFLIPSFMAAGLGYLLGKVRKLQQNFDSLRDELKQQRLTPDAQAQQPPVTEQKLDTQTQTVSTAQQPENQPPTQTNAVETATPKPVSSSTVRPEKPLLELNIFDKAINAGIDLVKRYFTGGNLFVRIGILVLFFGVSFLLKYVSDQGLLPIEYRLAGVALGGIALLGLGWRLRSKKTTYALLLQGAGIGILYLDIFAAFSLYHLIPSLAAFILLFAISMLAAALAVLQNAPTLAFVGFAGGFLAPILASSGSGNYIGLFSYYAILNIAIAAIAWFKAWRPLNLLGFGFTFVIALLWGLKSYTPDKLVYVEGFLIFFFLLYVGITVLYALRQPKHSSNQTGDAKTLHSYVDGSLLFGVPLGFAGFQYHLLQDTDYGVAFSAFALGLLYLGLSHLIWRKKGDSLRLLVEGFLALGVIFGSLAIPFAVAPTHTAAAWALEGLGLVWLGLRQQRISMRLFGYLIQIGAAGFVAYELLNDLGDYIFGSNTNQATAFLNSTFMSMSFIAISGILSAYLLFRHKTHCHRYEGYLSPVLLVWGLLWLLLGFFTQFVLHFDHDWLPTNYLLLFTGIAAVFGTWALKTQWRHALWVAMSVLPVMILVGFGMANQPSQNGGWLAWPLAFGVLYALFIVIDRNKQAIAISAQTTWYQLWHNGALLLATFLITMEGTAWLNTNELNDYIRLWAVLPALAAWWLLFKAPAYPFTQHHEHLKQWAGSMLFVVMTLWLIINITADGSPAWFGWLPVLNLTDMLTFIVLLSLVLLLLNQKHTVFAGALDKRVLLIGAAALAFLWLNFTLFRAAHHWWEQPYGIDVLLQQGFVQTALSVLWALTGVVVTVLASRKQWRMVWIAGGVLLALVVLKLFLVDLSQIGSLARILSFLIVGALLVSIGYFAPLPARSDDENAAISAKGETA